MPTHEECMVLTPIQRHRNPPLLGLVKWFLGSHRLSIYIYIYIKLASWFSKNWLIISCCPACVIIFNFNFVKILLVFKDDNLAG